MAAVTAKTALRNTTTHWQALDREHHMHPFTDQKELAQQGARVITKAEGTYLFDSEGNKLLDAFAGLWCVNVGYGRKELADVAHEQMMELPYYNTFFKTTTPPAVELSQVLADLTPPASQPCVLRLLGLRRQRHHRAHGPAVLEPGGQDAKKTIISRNNGYHGSTMVAASLGGMSYMHELADLPLPGFVHIMQPYWYGRGRRHDAGGVRPQGGARARGQDPGAGRRQCGGLLRRADPGRRRRDHSAGDLLAGDPAHLPEVRRAAGGRRGDLRLRPHRPLVRRRTTSRSSRTS